MRWRSLLEWKHSWWMVGAALVLVVVASTTRSVFERPQLEPDDYRYLELARQLSAGEGSLARLFLVENDWRHLWWLDVPGAVRFFRPTVLASFWLDEALHGGSAAGCLRTNVLLHAGCCLLVLACLSRILRSRFAAVAGATLFAAFACHAEVVWYGSGRTATLAAMGFLLGFLFHTSQRPWIRFLALPAYAFALLSKESMLGLPLVCLASRRCLGAAPAGWLHLLRERRWYYGGFALVAACYLVTRTYLLSRSGGASVVYPYFIVPWSSLFPAHLWLQVRNYAENLFFAQPTDPFLTPDQLPAYSTTVGGLVSAAALITLFACLRRRRRFGLLLLVALLTWLPASVVYTSERYLYVPSFALAGCAALLLERALTSRRATVLVLATLLLWTGHQGWWMARKTYALAVHPRPAYAIARQLSGLRGRVQGRELLFLDFPGDWVHAQFLQDQLRVELREPDLRARVLSVLPERATTSDLSVQREDPQSLRIAAPRPLIEGSHSLFPLSPLATGSRIERAELGFSVEVRRGQKESAAEIVVRFPKPPEHYLLLQFLPPPQYPGIRGAHILLGKMRAIDP